MKTGQKVMRVVAVVAVALAAGHVAQSGQKSSVQAASLMPAPTDPGPERVIAASAGDAPVQSLPETDRSFSPALPAPAPQISSPVAVPLAEPDRSPAGPDRIEAAACSAFLALAPRDGAMIDVLLADPCRPEARVVLRHGGLAVTYRTDPAGVLFASLPALQTDALVSARFAGNDRLEARIAVPGAAAMHRFGVQWMGPRAFAVNAFENGADYGDAGHVSTSAPGRPGAGNGFLTMLGDASVEMPMLAEIYTFPVPFRSLPVAVEAAVTEATCGQEILGEVLTAERGTVRLAELSVTMPGCDAVGDYLVLKNLVPDLKLASAN